jgi:hypothetical protein
MLAASKRKTTPLPKNVGEAKENQLPTINTLFGLLLHVTPVPSNPFQSIQKVRTSHRKRADARYRLITLSVDFCVLCDDKVYCE